MVSISTFDWSSLRNIHKIPRTDAIVMVATVITVVVTHDLSKGVLLGVLLSAIFFAAKISKVKVTSISSVDNSKKIYKVDGQIFFASVSDLVEQFAFNEPIKQVDIDLTNAHLWDDSAIGALDKIEMKFEQNHVKVQYIGLNAESRLLKRKIGGLSKASGH